MLKLHPLAVAAVCLTGACTGTLDQNVPLPGAGGSAGAESPASTAGVAGSGIEAFKTTLYPLLRSNCAHCHSTEVTAAHGAQAPIHADGNVELAHEYALTRVNFRSPADSKFVRRMGIDRHNCFGSSCKDANAQMLEAVEA